MADLTLADDPEAARAARRRAASIATIYGVLALFALIYLLPLVVVIFNSFRPLPEILQDGLIAFPRSIGFGAWGEAWSSYCINGLCEGMRGNFYNSLWMTIPATIISTLLGAVNGYVLSKWRFRGSETIFTIMLFGVFMPGQVALMPWAYILGATGLSNSTAGLVLVHSVQGLSFTTLFCRNYFVSIPDDLIKAARIDGAGFWRIFAKIVLPISPPILIVTVFGVVFTSGSEQPITAALVALSSNQTNVRNYDVMSAGVLIGALPPLLIYLFGGKYFVRGLTQGAVK
jgi:glucose/mannose transport system permease protein